MSFSFFFLTKSLLSLQNLGKTHLYNEKHTNGNSGAKCQT